MGNQVGFQRSLQAILEESQVFKCACRRAANIETKIVLKSKKIGACGGPRPSDPTIGKTVNSYSKIKQKIGACGAFQMSNWNCFQVKKQTGAHGGPTYNCRSSNCSKRQKKPALAASSSSSCQLKIVRKKKRRLWRAKTVELRITLKSKKNRRLQRAANIEAKLFWNQKNWRLRRATTIGKALLPMIRIAHGQKGDWE